MIKISPVYTILLCLGSLFASGCRTTDFTVLVEASQNMDVQVESMQKTFKTSTPVEQVKIRKQIIASRQKALTWATRINVQSIPQVANKSMTYDAGAALKQRWVAAASKKLEAAKSMTVVDVVPTSPNVEEISPKVETPTPKQ